MCQKTADLVIISSASAGWLVGWRKIINYFQGPCLVGGWEENKIIDLTVLVGGLVVLFVGKIVNFMNLL